MYSPNFNSEKFRSLILYIAQKSVEDRWFGAVKLNKILYYCDFTAFLMLRRSITGATYQRLPEGPAPRELLAERQAMLDEGLLTMETVRVISYVQHRLVPTNFDEDISQSFSLDELEIIDEVIEELSDMTAAEVSNMSHHEIGWIAASNFEDIPYETAWLAPKPYENLGVLPSQVR